MKDELPKVIHEGVIEIGDLRLRVYTLDNGMRVIDAEDLTPFLDALDGIEP